MPCDLNAVGPLLEHVADAKTKALPAEACCRDKGEDRLPVERELQRERLADVLETKLCASAKNEGISNPGVYCRTCIELERTYGSNLEIIGCADAHGVCTPTGINFEEVLATHKMLIGNFATPTNAYTECARLCACKCYESEHRNNDSQNLFHTRNNKVLV